MLKLISLLEGIRSFIGNGRINTIEDEYNAIVTGYVNKIHSGAIRSFIGSGQENEIMSDHSVVVGGNTNIIGTSADDSFIGHGP